MAEALCGICGISAARVLRRLPGGIVAVPADTARDGHVMVVSATHARTFSELTAGEADVFMALVAETARAVESASGATRCYVLRIGDKYPHPHFHIVPVADGDPPLAPFVFGEAGWSRGALADALPASAAFDPVFTADMRAVADRTPASPSRIPAALVSLSLMTLALAIALPLAWMLIGPPYAGPVAAGTSIGAGRIADDRMKGLPAGWGRALVLAVLAAATYYFLMQWLQR